MNPSGPRNTLNHHCQSRILGTQILLAILLLSGVVGVLATTGMDLAWYRDVGYPDSASLLRFRDFVRSGTIYPDPGQPPYFASLYGPLFYIILSLPYRLEEGLEGARLLARLGVIGFWVAGLTLLFLIVYRVTGSMKNGVLAILFAASPPVMAHWTTQIRSDLMGLAFSLASIYFVIGKARYGLLLGAVFSVLALLCKQTFVSAPLAVFLFLLWRRRFSHALIWGTAVSLGAMFAYGAIIWTEPYAWRELTIFSRPIYRFRSGLLLATQGLWNGAPLFALMGCLAPLGRRTEKRWGDELLLLLYTVLAWLVASTSIVQVGGSTNYFLEPLTASAALASMTLKNVEYTFAKASRVILIVAAIALVAFFYPLAKADVSLIQDVQFRAVHYASFRDDFQRFTASIAGRRLLSSYPDVTIYSAAPQVPDPLLNSVLSRLEKWSWNPIIEGLNHSDYELLAMYPYFLRGSGNYRDFSYWDERVFEAIKKNYELGGLCAGMEIWTPRKRHPGSWKYLPSEGCEPG